jgi:deoxyhypusine synthase
MVSNRIVVLVVVTGRSLTGDYFMNMTERCQLDDTTTDEKSRHMAGFERNTTIVICPFSDDRP